MSESHIPPLARPFIMAVATVAAIGGFLFGFDTSTMNSAMNGMKPDLHFDAAQLGLVTSISVVACVVAALGAGGASLRWGRTRVMAAAGIFVFSGEVLVGLATGIPMLLGGRLLVGLGIGSASSVIPAYVTEIAPKKLRGTLGTFWEYAIVIGQLLGLISGFLITNTVGSERLPGLFGVPVWRWMFAVTAAMGLFYFVAALLLPQSPADLVRHGKTAEARALIARIGGQDPSAAMAGLQQSLDRSASRGKGFQVLRGPVWGLSRSLWLAVGVVVFQQTLGITAVKMYSNAVWQSVGVSTADSFYVSIAMAVVSLIGTSVAVVVMGRADPWRLLLIGGAVASPSMLAMAFAFSQVDNSGLLPVQFGALAMIGMVAFTVAFSLSWGPAMWVVASALFDSGSRTQGLAVCSTLNWTANWLVSLSFPILAAAGASVPFWIYGTLAAVAVVFVRYARAHTTA